MIKITITHDLLCRFWPRVNKSNGCWIWIGAKTTRGYGVIYAPNRKKIYAHRVSYQISNGSIPDGMGVLHSCDNPPCVRPKHLFAGTQQDNIDDSINKRRWIFGNKNGSRTKPQPRHKFPHGERSGTAKLTWAKAEKIRSLYRTEQFSLRRLADMFGIAAHRTIYCVISGKTWKTQYDKNRLR